MCPTGFFISILFLFIFETAGFFLFFSIEDCSCPICPKVLCSKANKIRHLRETHKIENPHTYPSAAATLAKQ